MRTYMDDTIRGCPIGDVADLMFNRWTAPILWGLHHHGSMRFNELQRFLVDITPKVLTTRLRQLERDGLVIRRCVTDVPQRVEYEISELGRSLRPVFRTLDRWGATHLTAIAAARSEYDRLQAEEAAWAEG
ncbi:winged helix-turn-helix transcriptional regulator [Streptomyces sp. 4F14]|uniref:winged helix-turn-helix transcriptional regulator n=1 Tax=Streptomyces sp. 4F14 TaxID=3394380 RepID=UPI003A8AEA04